VHDALDPGVGHEPDESHDSIEHAGGQRQHEGQGNGKNIEDQRDIAFAVIAEGDRQGGILAMDRDQEQGQDGEGQGLAQ